LPAIIFGNGDQYWYKNGKYHRDDLDEKGRVLPAVICKNGLRHRDENGKTLPAIIYSDGNRHWYKNGKRRRDDRDENGKLLPASI